MTSTEHHDPVAVFTSGEQEVERNDDVPTPRKRAASADIVEEQEAKWMRSPHPSEASLALSPPASSVEG